jgi:hypothetical protein
VTQATAEHATPLAESSEQEVFAPLLGDHALG